MGRAMRKRVFGRMWTVKAHMSLRICAVLSGTSLSAIESLDSTKLVKENNVPDDTWLIRKMI